MVTSAIVAALAGLLFGYDAGIISGAILFIKETFNITPQQVGTLVSAVPLGALIAAAICGKLNDWLGRKKILFATAILFILGTLLSALAHDISMLYSGRLLIGLAIGVGSFSAPLYIAEISEQKHRGALVTLNQLAIVIGIFLAYLINYAFAASHNWRWMLGYGVIPALILFICCFFLPESPRWLVSKSKISEALKILRYIHGDQQANYEMAQLTQVAKVERMRFTDLMRRNFWKVLLLGILVSILTQAVGINAIIYYAPTIFQQTGFSAATTAILATTGIGLINVIFTLIAVRYLDKIGRRKLLMIGISGIVLSLIILSSAFAMGVNHSVSLAWLALGSMLLFVACQAFSTGPACWLIPSEIFPVSVRGLGMGLSVAFNWGTNVLVAALFPVVLAVWGGTIAFLIFLIIALIAWLYFYFYVPETKNVSLEQIELNLLDGKNTRELGISGSK